MRTRSSLTTNAFLLETIVFGTGDECVWRWGRMRFTLEMDAFGAGDERMHLSLETKAFGTGDTWQKRYSLHLGLLHITRM